MQLAVLFWFYKDFDLCRERLQELRGLNPGLPIYGLYGGSKEDVARAEGLRTVLDDLHIFSEARDAQWKWLNGDQVIADWMRRRGAQLIWDSLVIVQWDMLLAAPVTRLFGALQPGEALLSGFRSLSEVEPWWGWAGGRDPVKRTMLEDFRTWLREAAGYDGPLWCCLFIVVVLPRDFLARYAQEAPEAGFLEYKMPTLARLWGTPVRTDLGFDPWWAADPTTRDAPARLRLLNAVGEPLDPAVVAAELADPNGLRVFHPVRVPGSVFEPGLAVATSAGDKSA